MTIHIYRQPKDDPSAPRTLVAKLTKVSTPMEAEFILASLQIASKGLHSPHPDPYFLQWNYSMGIQPEPRISPTPFLDIQVDLSRATTSRRYFKYELSFSVSHGQRHYLAYSKRYGAIRATTVDHADGGRLLIARIRNVWPNADLVRL